MSKMRNRSFPQPHGIMFKNIQSIVKHCIYYIDNYNSCSIAVILSEQFND